MDKKLASNTKIFGPTKSECLMSPILPRGRNVSLTFFVHGEHICILGHSAHFTKSQEMELSAGVTDCPFLPGGSLWQR